MNNTLEKYLVPGAIVLDGRGPDNYIYIRGPDNYIYINNRSCIFWNDDTLYLSSLFEGLAIRTSDVVINFVNAIKISYELL